MKISRVLRSLSRRWLVLGATVLIASAQAEQCPFVVSGAPSTSARFAVDGVALSRYTQGVRGAALLTGLQGAGLATQGDGDGAISGTRLQLDVDGDGEFTRTDAVVISRYLAGVRPEAWFDGLTVASGAKRSSGAAVANYIAAGCPTSAAVVAGHPRVFINAARVAELKAALALPNSFPLNGTAFPQAQGALEFNIKPSLDADYALTGCGPGNTCRNVFDAYDSARGGHVFMREVNEASSPPPAGSAKYQIALQDGASYAAAFPNFSLTAGQWHTVRVTWNDSAHTTSLYIDGVLHTKRTGIPAWQPSAQRFEWAGRDALDNIRVYSSESASAASLVASFAMDEGMGAYAADAVAGFRLMLANPVRWTTGQGATGTAVQMGSTASGIGMRIAPPSPLIDAWLSTRTLADSQSVTLNAGGQVVNPATGHPDNLVDLARNLAMAWLLTEQTPYRQAALAYADQLVATAVSVGTEYEQGGRVGAMATLYDWMYDIMGGTVHAASGKTYRVRLGEAIRATLTQPGGVGLWQTVCGAADTVAPGSDWRCKSTFANGKATAGAIAGHDIGDRAMVQAAALALLDEYPDMSGLLGQIYEHDFHRDGEYAFRDWVATEGGSAMGWAYASGYAEHDSVKLWQIGTNLKVPETWQGKQVLRNIYGQRADLSFPAQGDTFSQSATNYTHLPQALWAAASSDASVAGVARNYYNQTLRPNMTWRGLSTGRVNELIFWQPGTTETPINTLPFARAFGRAGQVVMRDRWDAAATLLEFKSSSFWHEAHHHLDQNAFTLYYKAPLLVDSGYYDAYATLHWQNYYTRSIAHNTITAWSPNESFVKACSGGTALSNDGGQRFLHAYDAVTGERCHYPWLEDIQPGGSNALDGVTAFESTSDYAYAVGNASKAYDAAKLDQTDGFVRSVVFIPAPGFWAKPVAVVFDRLKASAQGSALTRRFLLHTTNEPEAESAGTLLRAGVTLLTGTTFAVRNGKGMLYSQTLLPANPVVWKVGGVVGANDYRFMVPTAGATDYLTGLTQFAPNVAPPADNADVGAWRLEISAATPTSQSYFLHVFSVADNDGSVTAPPVAVERSSASAAVALIAAGQPNAQALVFNKSGVPAASLNWTQAEAVPSKLWVAGLVASARYDAWTEASGDSARPRRVMIQQTTTGGWTSSAQGVLSINATLPQR